MPQEDVSCMVHMKYIDNCIQPVISNLVMDLIKTRPDDPVPTMVATLSKIIAEADEKAKAEAIKLNN